jgi:hypothetical protein
MEEKEKRKNMMMMAPELICNSERVKVKEKLPRS